MGTTSPISHIVLIVRENKTYDFLLGGVEPGDDAGAAFQIDNVRRARKTICATGRCPIVPNIKKLAYEFASHDNFYANSEVSMTGHAWLTGSYVNDYLQRAFTESEGPQSLLGFDFSDEVGFPPAAPGPGTFFEHLLKYDVDFVDLGELTGVLGHYGDEFVLNHVDVTYQGTANLNVSDIDRATSAIARLVTNGDFPPFVYMELPRDHTLGVSAGAPKPEYMIAENDEATGRVVDAISHSRFWSSTAIFIVEDDPQEGYDHVDYHRTICVVVSPWAKRHYTSHTQAAFPSLFRTFELILGIPPMNRYDEYAMPLRDAFTSSPRFDPFSYEPSHVALSYVEDSTPTLESVVTSRIDFTDVDRSPLLGEVVWKSLTGDFPRPSRILEMAASGRLFVPSVTDDEDPSRSQKK